MPEVTNFLLQFFSSSDDTEVKEAAILALGHIGTKQVVNPILEYLASGQEDLSYACITALGHIGDPRAINPLIQALEKKEQILIPFLKLLQKL